MAIGSVSVEVVPDARGFHQKLKAEFADLKVKVGVNLDTGKAKAELDKLAMTRRSAKITADADTKLAAAKLDKLAKTRTTKIRASVDKSSFGRAQASVNKTASSMGSLVDAAFALGPALIPATAAITAMAGALAAPIATAGVGAGLFGVLSVAAIAKATKDAKAVEQSQKKVAGFQALSQKYADKAAAASGKQATNYRKQADAYDKQAKAQQKATDQMLAGLPAGEQRFIKASRTISKGFDTLLRKSHVFEPLTAGALLLGKVLPRLSPITDAFGHAITGVVNQLSKFSDSHGFRSAIQFIARDGSSAFLQFIHITKNLAVGVGGLIQAFAPMGTSVLSSIGRATAAFRRFGEAAGSGKSAGFQNFLDYVRRVGPKVGTTLVDIGRAVGKVVLALAPQGSTVLGVIDALAKAVAKMKPSQIAAVAVAVGALGLATGKFSGLKGLSLLIAGLSYAYNHSNAFRTLANDAGKLAAQLNNLPDVAKLLGGGALLAGALKLRGGGTKGGVAGVAAKLVGGGIQKVLVVNWPVGGVPGVPGVPGKVPPVVPVAEGGGISAALRFALGALLRAPAAGAVGHDTAPKGQDFGGRKLLTASMPQLSSLGKLSGEPTNNLTEVNVAISKLDASFAKLAKSNPQAALRKVQAAAQSSGIPLKELAILLPKTAEGVGGFNKKSVEAAVAVQKLAASNRKSLYTFSGLAQATAKVGISTKATARMFRSLPKTVQTRILTPGALKSKADIRALGKQFGLTPKQIQSIIKLVGARDAIDKTAKTQKGLRKLNTTSARPKVVPQGNEATDNKVNKNIRGFRTLNRTSAKPHVQPQGTEATNAKIAKNTAGLRRLNTTSAKPKVNLIDNASGKLHSISGLMGGLHDRTVTFTTIHRDVRVGGGRGTAANPTLNARGGYITGPGTGTSDSIHTRLSNGEFVINAAATRRNRALLEAINGHQSATGSRMAMGGPVSSRNSSPSGMAMNFNGDIYTVDPKATAREIEKRTRASIAYMGGGIQ